MVRDREASGLLAGRAWVESGAEKMDVPQRAQEILVLLLFVPGGEYEEGISESRVMEDTGSMIS
jgi:hypothetical protein